MGFLETVGRVGVAGVCPGFAVYHFIIRGLPLKELLLTALGERSPVSNIYFHMNTIDTNV